MSHFVVVVVITLLLVFIVWWLKKLLEARNSILIKIPGHTLYDPFFGSFPILRSIDFIKRWRLNYEKYGTVHRIYTFNCVPYIVCTDPEVIRHVAVTNSKNYIRGPLGSVESFRYVVGDNSLFLLNSEAHKFHRSLVSPAFRPCNIKTFVPVIVNCTNRLIQHFDELLTSSESGQIVLDIKKHFSHVTLNVIGLAGFGFDFDCVGKSSPIAKCVEDIVGAADLFKFSLLTGLANKVPFICSLFSSKIEKFEAGVQKTRQLLKHMVDTKRETLIEWQGSEVTLLELIISSSNKEKGLSNKELEDELMTFILAGHETSSLALTYSIYFLSKYKSWQTKCRNEVRKLLQKETKLNSEMLAEMKILKAVINESLRLHTPAPVVLRQCVDDDYLKEHYIPAGTNVSLLLGQMHRLPEYWPEPDEFKPERFLQNNGELAHSNAFLPFGDGFHKCIGYQFALTEIVAVLALLLHRFEFELESKEDMQCILSVVLSPKYPVILKLRKAETTETSSFK